MTSELDTLIILKYKPITYDRAYVEMLSDDLVEFLLDDIYPGVRSKTFFDPFPSNRSLLLDAMHKSKLAHHGKFTQEGFEDQFFEAIGRHELS
jgi:hypothetical protein